jgi:hypothetical protein
MLRRKVIAALLGASLLGPVACSHLMSSRDDCVDGIGNVRTHSNSEASLEAIAHDLDHIEKHIDLYGSITTKHPDIWGSARLTKYQQEVEGIFAKEADATNVTNQVTTFQGARARTDQAFLASAVAMNLALSGQQAALLSPDPVTVQTGTSTTYSKDVTEGKVVDKNLQSTTGSTTTNGTKTSTDQQSGQDLTRNLKTGTDASQTQTTAAPSAVKVPTSAAIPSDFTTYTDSKVNVNRNPATIAGMPGFGSGALKLEPSIILDEKKRFLDHLNQIRRINEGDDTADSPGYALYLMRVPVSVLPGKKTDVGHGAEITMSIKPVLGDDLLPSTFRNLIINDMVDQFSELITVLLNSDREALKVLRAELSNDELDKIDDKSKFTLRAAISRVKPRYTSPRPSRHAEFAFPMNNLQELFGDTYLRALIHAATERYAEEIKLNKVVHLHEVRSVVREQIVAAYRFLATGNPDAWSLCSPELARSVRDLNGNRVGTLSILHNHQKQYDQMFGRELGKEKRIDSDRLVFKALGWGILLESALLTDLLVRDIKETMSNKGLAPITEAWLDYYSPTPSPAAKHAFNEYVAARWPMYTFAIDPVTEQQNIQDTLSQRREMQLAMSLAFASGNITASQMTRFARRLEADYQTIDLNRTVVGFSHGNNTFGWRFYPRFQTPAIPGNLEVLARDLLGGRSFNKDQELRERRLEPGQRECTALVIMPSFVPFAEVNISSTWFNLANPKHISTSTHDNVKLSRMVRSIEKVMPSHKHIDNYLPGEYNRLQAKASMLAARFPLQEMKFQVPYENTLGGFEFFNSGITDLVPQLRGWYGIAGYEGKAVDVFLMGDNFSINNSQIIAGGKYIQPALLSRQVLRVTLPESLAASESGNFEYSESGKYIDVRLATPYGIGGPLRIPVVVKKQAEPKAPALDPQINAQMIYLDRDTDIIISGDNFTADMRVVVGGKACAFELISKRTVRITVPKGLTPKLEKGVRIIYVTVANAGGVSDILALPTAAPVPDSKPASIGVPGMATFGSKTLEIGFRYKNLGIEGVAEPNRQPPLVVAIPREKPIEPLVIELTFPNFKIELKGIKLNAARNSTEDISGLLMSEILKRVAATFGPEDVNPVKELEAKATVTWMGGPILPIEDTLRIKWVKVK